MSPRELRLRERIDALVEQREELRRIIFTINGDLDERLRDKLDQLRDKNDSLVRTLNRRDKQLRKARETAIRHRKRARELEASLELWRKRSREHQYHAMLYRQSKRNRRYYARTKAAA